MKSTTTLANSCEADFIEMIIQNISGIESSEGEISSLLRTEK